MKTLKELIDNKKIPAKQFAKIEKAKKENPKLFNYNQACRASGGLGNFVIFVNSALKYYNDTK